MVSQLREQTRFSCELQLAKQLSSNGSSSGAGSKLVLVAVMLVGMRNRIRHKESNISYE